MSVPENEKRRPLVTDGAQENGHETASTPSQHTPNIAGISGLGEGEGLVPSKQAVRDALRLTHPEGPWHVSAKRAKGFIHGALVDAADAADARTAANALAPDLTAPFAGFTAVLVADTASVGFTNALIQGDVVGSAYAGPRRGH